MSETSDPPGRAEAADDDALPPSYARVEGLHLRQWAARAVLPLGLAAGNGAGFLDVAWLPRHDLPVTLLGWPAWTVAVTPAAGALLLVVATLLRVASKGVLVRKTEVTRDGVYRWCRHPFYLAVLVGGVGTLLLAGPLGAVVAVVWLVPTAIVHVVTMAGEEVRLAALHGAVWTSYAAEVPRLIPWKGAAGEPPEPRTRVTWANLVDEREPPRLLRFLGSAALVRGFAMGPTAGLLLALTGVALQAVSHLLPGGRRSRRA